MDIKYLKDKIIDGIKIKKTSKNNQYEIIYFGGYIGTEFGEEVEVESNLWSIKKDLKELNGKIVCVYEDKNIGYGKCIVNF